MTRTGESSRPALISHPAHPEHELVLAAAEQKFECNGCKQHGKGISYRCEPCDYDIHTCCVPPETSLKHPLLNGCKLDFLLKPPGPRRMCDACGEEVLGFVYYNRDRDIDLHPCCATNPQRVVLDGVMFNLHAERDSAHICGRCKQNGRRNSFWSYRARDDDGKLVYLHLGCIINGAGSQVQSQVESVPTELQNAPGRMTWYRSVWKITKIVAKLSYYLLCFDGAGLFAMAGDAVDYFGS